MLKTVFDDLRNQFFIVVAIIIALCLAILLIFLPRPIREPKLPDVTPTPAATNTPWIITATPSSPTSTPESRLTREQWQQKILSIAPSIYCCYEEWQDYALVYGPNYTPWVGYTAYLYQEDSSPDGQSHGRVEITVYENNAEATRIAQWYYTQFPGDIFHFNINYENQSSSKFSMYTEDIDYIYPPEVSEPKQRVFLFGMIQQENVIIYYKTYTPITPGVDERAAVIELDDNLESITYALDMDTVPVLNYYDTNR